MADTLGRYLSQATTFLAPRSIDVADTLLRQFAFWLLEHTDVRTIAVVGRGSTTRNVSCDDTEPSISASPCKRTAA